ncbi:alpha-1,3-rhamnosyltransferase [Acinetobacter calcoaceticus]|uniref:Alpha-1,3-rhamnosyltransferase n=1 Tax=Acinetobacter calcoaceticus TaxID=471 RepID=A0A4V2R0E3_ACICA|nr:alpha-1,3-rhamnosyltransferase [Acinetobacter calcoaceticus]
MEVNNQPLVSVVIPSYNHEQYVQDSIQSVIDQAYENIELIIIDDGSKDSSVQKIEQMVDACTQRFSRFEFRSRPNKGLSATLNEALEWCQGEFLSPLASDDKMFDHKTKRQVELLANQNNYVAVFGAVEIIDNNGVKTGEIRQEDKVFNFNDLIYTDRFLPAPTQMIRLNSLRAIGGFVEGMLIEDWYIYLRLLEGGNSILYKDEIFAYYRNHGGNTFSNPYKMALGRLQVLNEFSRHEYFKKAFIKASWDNVIEITRKDFRLSILILIHRISHKIKMIFSRMVRK